MKIDLTKKQFRDLAMIVHTAGSVFGILGDFIPDEPYKSQSERIDEFEEYLLSFCKDFDCEDLTEIWDGRIIMSDRVSEEFQEIMDEYDDFTFWSELEMRMGKRDFECTITEEEKCYIEKNNGWLPERIHNLYEKYRKEFEKYGIDRLDIKDDKRTLG